MHEIKMIGLINSQPPLAAAIAKESLDVALILGSYEQNVSLIFIGDGVFQLSADQQPEKVSSKDFLKTFGALPFYDIENIYVCEASLVERGLPLSFNIDDVNIVTSAQLSKVIAEQDVLLRF